MVMEGLCACTLSRLCVCVSVLAQEMTYNVTLAVGWWIAVLLNIRNQIILMSRWQVNNWFLSLTVQKKNKKNNTKVMYHSCACKN